MKNTLTFVAIILLSLNSYSQGFKKMTIVKTDHKKIETSGKFIYKNNLISDILLKNSKSNLNLQSTPKVIVGKKQYVVKDSTLNVLN